MIIQAELRRKQSEYEGEACSVDKVIELPAQRFKQFSRALLADYDFIAENKNAIRHDEDARHCLLILDADGTDGFLVAHLTGAARTLDFATDTYGAASNVVLPFTKITEGDDACQHGNASHVAMELCPGNPYRTHLYSFR